MMHPGEDVHLLTKHRGPPPPYYAGVCTHHQDPTSVRQPTMLTCPMQSDTSGEDESLDEESHQPSIFPVLHCTDANIACGCPLCQLRYYVTYLYSDQRQASRHVISVFPSPNGIPQPPPPAYRPDCGPGCPTFEWFGFCTYDRDCYMEHIKRRPPLLAPMGSAEAELRRIIAKSEQMRGKQLWTCDVCGYHGVTDRSVASVGEVIFFRQCPMCNFMCYLPHITYLVSAIVADVGDDYQLYKSEIERFREQLPPEFKAPLSAEAHIIGHTRFGWSLIRPVEMKMAVEAAIAALPEMKGIVSVGSGTGYVEHVLNRVLNPHVRPLESSRWQLPNPEKFSTTSFDGVRADLSGLAEGGRVDIFAFDELALRASYSVHVSLGGPLSILSFPCKNTVLLLCWPPFGGPVDELSSMAYESLLYFLQSGGSIVIYIGDVTSTGDWRFHQLLYTHFKLVEPYTVRHELRRWSPQEMGLVFAGSDSVGVYARRDTPLVLPPNWTCGM